MIVLIVLFLQIYAVFLTISRTLAFFFVFLQQYQRLERRSSLFFHSMTKFLKYCFLMVLAFSPLDTGAHTIMGDLNGDGKVGIPDITALVDYLLFKDSSHEFIESADVSRDRIIDIVDLTILIDYVLHYVPAQPIEPEQVSFTLLHLSDSHGYAEGLNQAIRELEDNSIDVLLFTGDWTRHAIEGRTAITTTATATAFNEIKSKYGNRFLMLAGNHDVYDNKTVGQTQSGTTAAIKGWMANSGVTWGDASGIASYWYKDYSLTSTRKLRIIALDQYETTNVGKPIGDWNYQPIYSQAQIDWLIARLKELSADDYLIIALHEPAYNDTSDGVNTMEAVAMADDNLWCSADFSKFNYRGAEECRNLLPNIMRNYLNSQTECWQHINLDMDTTTITVNADFYGNPPCHFLFYIGGHRHCDIVHELPLVDNYGVATGFDRQMMMHVAAADWTVQSSKDDDLLIEYEDASRYEKTGYLKADENDPDYRINKVVINFTSRQVTLLRIGATHTHHGTVRDAFEFSFTN